jgi:hypothetical protein
MLDHWQQRTYGIYSLIGLEIWGRMYLMGEDSHQVTARIEALANARRGVRPAAKAAPPEPSRLTN